MRAKLPLLFIALVAGCAKNGSPPSHEELAAFVESQAYNLVRQKLRDPSGAVFSDVTVSWKSGQPIACGKVNAANGFGGKAGAQRFLSSGTIVTVLEEEVKDREFDGVLARYC